MPIKLGRIPSSVRSGGDFVQRGVAGASGGTQDASFSQAAVPPGRWAKAGIQDPAVDNAPPWFNGRPFTESRLANGDTYKNWGDAFRNTYAGYEFGAPPPEPKTAEPKAFSSGSEEVA